MKATGIVRRIDELGSDDFNELSGNIKPVCQVVIFLVSSL